MLLCCILFVLMPFQAFAHSKLTESIPADNETISESPERISLKFNTSISSVSTFTLVNEGGEEQQVDNIAVNDNELSGDVIAVLANGTYSVKWNIIGADGHAIEGASSFTVQAAEAEPTNDANSAEQGTETTEPDTAPSAEPTPEATVQPSADTSSDVATENTPSDSSKSTAVWPYVIIGVLIIAVVVFAMRKRK